MPDSSEYFYKWDFHFWDENYIGEKNSKKKRAGEGTIEWYLGEIGNWRFEDWALWHSEDSSKYDLEDKLNPDRKLTGDKITFKGIFKNNYPCGEGKFFLNDKLIFEGQFNDGFIHGKARFKINFHTLSFGILNNYIKVSEYSNIENNEEFLKKMKTNKDLGTFDGEFKEGLANGYGELELKNGLTYKGNWIDGYPSGKGVKTYEDGTIESGEFGILNEKTISLLPKDYIEDENGQFLYGLRTFQNKSENVDRRTLIQKASSKIKDL